MKISFAFVVVIEAFTMIVGSFFQSIAAIDETCSSSFAFEHCSRSFLFFEPQSCFLKSSFDSHLEAHFVAGDC